MPTLREPDYATECTNEQRIAAISKAFRLATPGDVVNLKAGIYNADDFPPFPPGVTVKGEGPGRTILCSPRRLLVDRPGIPDQATTFELGDGGTLQDLELRPTAAKNLQTAVLGFGTPATKKRFATIQNVWISGGVWGFYNWHGVGNEITIDKCQFTVARIGITQGVSSGLDAAALTITDTIVRLVDDLSTYGKPNDGESVTHKEWGGQIGALLRGGHTKIDGLTVEASGPAPGTGPRVVAVSDWLDLDSSVHTIVELGRLRTKLTRNGAAELFDVDVRYGSRRLAGSFGSGKKKDGTPSGEITVCTLPPLVRKK